MPAASMTMAINIMVINENPEFFISIRAPRSAGAKNLRAFFLLVVLIVVQQIAAATGFLGGTRNSGDSNT